MVVSAPSGAGKTTLIKKLLATDDRFTFSVSTTTRPRRPGELDGQSYYFASVDEFRQKIEKNEFIEWAIVHRNYYGTTKKEVDRLGLMGKIPIFDVDVQGARQLKKKIEGSVFVFIVPPSLEVLRERLKKRETESREERDLRLENALQELGEYGLYDYIVVNDSLDRALRELQAIIAAEMCRTPRMSGFIKSWGI